MQNKKDQTKVVAFETTLPSQVREDVISTKDLEMEFLYGGPIIPSGSLFEIMDQISMSDKWMPVRITRTEHKIERIFLVDCSNLPRGFLTYKQWQREDEQCDDLSDIVSISVEWWKDNLFTKRQVAELQGLEVMFMGEDARAKMMMKSRHHYDVSNLPLDLRQAVDEVSQGEDMCLRQCIEFLLGERGWRDYKEEKYEHEVVLVTDTNMVVTRKCKLDGSKISFDVWYMTNNYMAHQIYFDSLEAAKEYIRIDALGR